MPTARLPETSTRWCGPCPWTSAEGLLTRRNSAGNSNRSAPGKETTRRLRSRVTRISSGTRMSSCLLISSMVTSPPCEMWAKREPRGRGAASPRRAASAADLDTLLVGVEFPCLIDQHDRDAVADRIGKAGLVADQFLARGVIAQRPLGQR